MRSIFILNSGLILGGQNSSKRQTVFFLLVDPRDKSHKDPAIETKQKEAHKGPRTLTEINNGRHSVHLLHGGMGNFHGGLLILMKVTMEMNQVLTERGHLLNSIWNNSSGQDFLEFNNFVTDGSFTADSGLQ